MNQNEIVEDDLTLVVKPCLCWSMQHRSYFSCLSILMIIGLTFSLFTSVFSVYKLPNFQTIYSPTTDFVILVLLVVIYCRYMRSKEYGNCLAYCFSLFCLIISVIDLVLFILGGFIFVFIGLDSLPETYKMNPILFFVLLYCVIVPLAAYKIYLFHLYVTVIRTRLFAVENQVYEELESQESVAKDDL